MPESVNITYDQLQKLMAEAMTSAIRAAKEPDPLRQREIDKEIEKDKRRSLMMIALAKAEEEARLLKKDRCTHCAYPSGHERAGELAPSNLESKKWTTGGQLTGESEEIATLVCQRCG